MMVRDHLDLLLNLIRFSHALRIREVTVTTDRVLVALRGLCFIDIRQKSDFYDLLKASFVSRREDVECFDELFKEFWSPADDAILSAGEMAQIAPKGPDEEEGFRIREREADSQERTKVDENDILPDCSPEEILIRKDFSSLQAEELEQVREYVMELSRKMALALSRRVKQGKRKRLLDFRQTIRHSVRQGGEILELRWKRPKPKPLRIVFLCDVSGSMDTYGQFILFFMYAIQYFYLYCETFAFGTRLTRVTEIFQKEKTFEKVLQFLSRELLDWSGGTNIGGALHQLRRRYPCLLRSNRTIFLLFSDGWEQGDAVLLETEMKVEDIEELLNSRIIEAYSRGYSVVEITKALKKTTVDWVYDLLRDTGHIPAMERGEYRRQYDIKLCTYDPTIIDAFERLRKNRKQAAFTHEALKYFFSTEKGGQVLLLMEGGASEVSSTIATLELNSTGAETPDNRGVKNHSIFTPQNDSSKVLDSILV